MFEFRSQDLSSIAPQQRLRKRHEFIGPAVRAARQSYERARFRAQIAGLWAMVLGRPRRLYELAEVEAQTVVRSRRAAGTQPVQVQQIRGSENRVRDFDAAFLPLQGHTKERWINLWAAMFLGADIPAVKLIQIGDMYFVQDGHHRVSVARALGLEYIDAAVVVWDVVGCLPWVCEPVCAVAHLPA